jgi:hypothetical protein
MPSANGDVVFTQRIWRLVVAVLVLVGIAIGWMAHVYISDLRAIKG